MTTSGPPQDDALASPTYQRAFLKAMNGEADTLTEEERAAVQAAREQAGGPSYPMPSRTED